MKNKDLEFTEQMLKRHYAIEHATYEYCQTLMQFDKGDEETKYPWNALVLAQIREYAVETLREYGYPVCDPYITLDYIDKYCSLKECGKWLPACPPMLLAELSRCYGWFYVFL